MANRPALVSLKKKGKCGLIMRMICFVLVSLCNKCEVERDKERKTLAIYGRQTPQTCMRSALVSFILSRSLKVTVIYNQTLNFK